MGNLQNLFKILSRKKRIASIDISENNLEKYPEKKKIENSNIIKIHVYGVGERKIKVMNQLFDSKITREDLKAFGDNEYKTNDFYWIIKKYEDTLLTSDKCDELEVLIENEKTGQDFQIKHHILLLFGDDNDIRMIVEEFSNINRPRIIFVTEKEKEYPHFKNQKYVKNIVCEGMNDQKLNNYIISSIWELDCYFNEKGNEIDRYSPKSIVKGLETDNSFFSINILLTGLCRSGKSTFINLLTEKLVALESNESESVTLKVSEYYIHRNDDKKEHGAIKLIDTPGLCDDKDVNQKVLEQINSFLENKKNEIEKQIHFIFFFFMEGNPLLSSKELLKLLDKHNYPVFFIINKSHDKSWKGSKSQDIKSKILFLKKKDCDCPNLAKEENFIQVNIKSTSDQIKDFYGVDDIFKKIEKFIKNNLLDENILKNLNEIHNNYQRAKIKNENTDDIINQKIFDDLKNNLLFKNITLDNIKRHGRKIAEKYEKNIILLSSLKNVFPAQYKDIPKTALLQAFMIKEIGIGYGFDFNNLNYCFRQFDKDLKNMNLDDENVITEKENSRSYNNEEIENQKSELQSKIDELFSDTNEEVIKRLAGKIIKLTSNTKTNNNNNNNNKINDDMKFIKDTRAISLLCQTYFENELDSTNGIPFIIYYFQKNQKLLDDIKFFIDKKDWEKETIEIIKKK